MLMEVTVQTRYFGQNCINRWNYYSDGSPGTLSRAVLLANGMGFIRQGDPPEYPTNTILRAWRELVPTAVEFIGFNILSVHDDFDLFSQAFVTGTVGLQENAGDPLPPFAAWGFRSSRTRQDIRRGYKRFVGVGEAQQGSGGNVGETWIAYQNNLALAMSVPLTVNEGEVSVVFQPVIVQREEYTTPSGRKARRYYADPSEQLQHTMFFITWEAYNQVRSQTSRQYGRGF
jgi:hypothetical protein